VTLTVCDNDISMHSTIGKRAERAFQNQIQISTQYQFSGFWKLITHSGQSGLQPDRVGLLIVKRRTPDHLRMSHTRERSSVTGWLIEMASAFEPHSRSIKH